MSKQIVSRRCGHCNGTGLRASAGLTRTLEAITNEWQTTPQIAHLLERNDTSIDGLLNELCSQGLIERRRRNARGAGYEWRLYPHQPPQGS